MLSRIVPCGVALMVLVAVAPTAAQYIDPDTCSMAEHACYQARQERDQRNAASEQEQRKMTAARMARARASSGGMPPLVQGKGGPIAYRSGRGGAKQVIVAITDYDYAMAFEIASPNSIVDSNGCVLVRVGAPGANAGANAATAPGNARAGANSSVSPAAGAMPQVAAVAPEAPRSTLARPSPEVCRNTLLDKLGKVGVNQVRAVSDARFREPAIDGKEPNTGNMRIDLRGSACDDPRIKATLYDFDANGILQSITYVWDRPAGPAPAPIFSERVAQLSRIHLLPPPQSPGRLQADTSMGRLIIEDLPERNLLLEAYKAKN